MRFLLYVAGCCFDGVGYEPNQAAHMGLGCLGDDFDIRLCYGPDVAEEITDAEITTLYNAVRKSLKLPTVILNDPQSRPFSPKHYCDLGMGGGGVEIPIEYVTLFDVLDIGE